jgi:hypothetical protein
MRSEDLAEGFRGQDRVANVEKKSHDTVHNIIIERQGAKSVCGHDRGGKEKVAVQANIQKGNPPKADNMWFTHGQTLGCSDRFLNLRAVTESQGRWSVGRSLTAVRRVRN